MAVRGGHLADRPRASMLAAGGAMPSRFRFFDNRQKYLLFVSTCTEKRLVAQRIEEELASIKPRPPALRVFDAGVGDGTVLTRLMRSMHDAFPTVPFYIVGKEISLEDVRLALEKMPDRFYEHPSTVLVMTNMYYSESPWLRPNSMAAASGLLWHELALTGRTAGQFERQITAAGFSVRELDRQDQQGERQSHYERPVVLAIYRDDHKLLLDSVLPKQEPAARISISSLRHSLTGAHPSNSRRRRWWRSWRGLRPGGRLVGIHSVRPRPRPRDHPARRPGENLYVMDRHQILKASKQALVRRPRLSFNAYSDQRALFRYHMHTLPSEISSSIGTSTLMAAWNAAIYVAQIEDDACRPSWRTAAISRPRATCCRTRRSLVPE